jgi:hypothetical protein
MASNINPFNIDGTYPVAGQDNDSQGFRDNFTNTSTNFSTAYTEISDLQSKVLLKSALTGQSLNNSMGGAAISGLALTGASYTFNNRGTLSGAVTLDFSTGNFQKIVSGGSLTLGFSNWPATGTLGSMVVWLNITNVAHTVTVGTTYSNLIDIVGADANTGVITFDTVGNYLLEFITTDAGVTVLIAERNRNYASIRDKNLYFNDTVANTLFVGYGPAITTAIAYNSGQSVITAAGSINTSAVGNLTLANLTNSRIDTGYLSGYTVTSSRGNLQTPSILPANSNDYLGFHNAVTFTGNGAGNVFQQVSSMAFYATGSNVTYGLGGNIAFLTARDGGTDAVSFVRQAVGIENDQSTKLYGNLITSNTFVPSSSTTVGGVAGQFSFDGTSMYICIGSGNWKKVTLSTF